MALGAAFMADSLGLFYWLLIALAVVAGFVFLWQLVDHFDLRKCWQPLVVCIVTVFIARYVGGQADDFRAMATAAGTGLEPGDGLGMVVMLALGSALIVVPFVLLFSGSGNKPNGQ